MKLICACYDDNEGMDVHRGARCWAIGGSTERWTNRAGYYSLPNDSCANDWLMHVMAVGSCAGGPEVTYQVYMHPHILAHKTQHAKAIIVQQQYQ